MLALMVRRSRPWMIAAMPRMSGIAITITQPSGPPVRKIIATNRITNGRSLMADSVAEAKKSRTTSTCARWCAYEPDDAGRCSMRTPRVWRNSSEPMIRSALRPAMSIRWLRNWRASKSNNKASKAPLASAHSVTKALCGITLSYTTETTRPITSISTLLINAANRAER